MRITGLGHAGLLVETEHGSVLCDPWVNPAYHGSWYPFPDNRGLDWANLATADFLYISHRHQDHLDARLLREHVPTSTPVLLPEYPTRDLERDLASLGYRDVVRVPADEPLDLGGLRVLVSPLRGPGDGPVGDSALAVDDGRHAILNQNDAHPVDLAPLRAFAAYDVHLTQHSGAIWWPMVYDLPRQAKQAFARLKREAQYTRALHYVREIGAQVVLPFAGPPCFLDEELFALNGRGTDGTSIFVDQLEFLERLRADVPQVDARMFLPGTVVTLDEDVTVHDTLYSEADAHEVFADKSGYLRRYQASVRSQKVVQDAPRPLSTSVTAESVYAGLRDWFEPLMRRAPIISAAVRGGVRLSAGDVHLVLDFERSEVRPLADERTRYWFEIPLELVVDCLVRREVDWCNSVFLSLRFATGRIGKFNEKLYTFFACLSEERIDHVERWYAARVEDGPQIEFGEWTVQRSCPHLGADLATVGRLDGHVLTCTLHDWRFDLRTGTCLTSEGVRISARRTAEGDGDAGVEDGSPALQRSVVPVPAIGRANASVAAARPPTKSHTPPSTPDMPDPMSTSPPTNSANATTNRATAPA
ncbi:Rieske 2Fe-2S domain-containing protein [Cellulosimicrobium cellulans]|uniref:Rieske 2Fe-2S domain-containing protein n=1 Tax=Cellulosimicrobium cellulans TaxID=1710 RepID=UPI001D16DE3B|nr:Rieske 2Fe-2S domain-containing protein [Cellulosimicrobium cellulans]